MPCCADELDTFLDKYLEKADKQVTDCFAPKNLLLELTKGAGSSCWLVITREQHPAKNEEEKVEAIAEKPEVAKETLKEEQEEGKLESCEPAREPPRPLEDIGLVVYSRSVSSSTGKKRVEMLHVSTREKKNFRAALTSSVHRVVTTEHFHEFVIPFFYQKEAETGRFVYDKEMRGVFNDLRFKSKVLRQDKRKRHRILDLFLPHLRGGIGTEEPATDAASMRF